MASKNLRKIKSMGLTGFGFTDDFNPHKYTVNWARFQKYVDKKEKSMVFNSLFRPLYKALLAKEMGAYIEGGHTLSAALKREITENVKQIAKEMVQTKLKASSNSTKQSYKEQEDVLTEG